MGPTGIRRGSWGRRPRRRGAAFLLAAALAAALAGAPSGGDRALAGAEPKPVFELLHLWVSAVEQPALQVLKDTVTRAGLQWQEHPVKGNFYGVRRELSERIALNLTPSAAFWIGAAETDRLQSGGVFRRLSSELIDGNVSSFLIPEITREIADTAGLTSLPLVIHLQNVAILNKDVFARLGLQHPASWAEFVQMAPKIRASGVTPLAVSGQRWLFRFLYLSILAGELQQQEFVDFLAGALPRDRFVAAALRSFELLRALKSHANADFDRIDWSDAVDMVSNGTAAITISGDFAAPGLKDRQGVVCDLAPGNSFAMWSFDVLVFPEQKDPGAQNIAIRALATEDTLTRFGVAKGGIPVVAGMDPDRLDPCSRRSLTNWRSHDKVLLSDYKWRRPLNSVSSLAQFVWNSDASEIENVANQLFGELSSIAK